MWSIKICRKSVSFQDCYDMDNSDITLPQSSAASLNCHEEALRALCKSLLKSRLFRGFYKERRYVERLNGYRDIVALHCEERDLEKLLLDAQYKLQVFYKHQPVFVWIGITHGANIARHPGALNTCIWAELADLAFGEYWFCIKNVRFRSNEIVLKLKTVRVIESHIAEQWHRSVDSLPTKPAMGATGYNNISTTATNLRPTAFGATYYPKHPQAAIEHSDPQQIHTEPAINLHDFVNIFRQWGYCVKCAIYDFMSNDISKENIVAVLRFIGLIIASLLSGSMVAIQFLGTFTLRFMFEFSRVMNAFTPIALKIIEVLNKIIGGFFILLAMIWRDLMGKKVKRNVPPEEGMRRIEYSRPLYKDVQYSWRQQNQRGSFPCPTEFERKFQ